MSEKIYYKIVSKFASGTFHSFNSSVQEACVEYKIGEWTAPIIFNSKLFVFDSLWAVKESEYMSYGDSRLFECEIEGEPIAVRSIELTMGNYERFWALWNSGQVSSNNWAPFGSLFVDKVKLIKEIDL